MSAPIIVDRYSVKTSISPGGGKVNTIITDGTVGSKRLGLAYILVEPGRSAHSMHIHEGRQRAEGYTLEYPSEFEQVYFIIHGKGVARWIEDGLVKEREVGEGNVIYFPIDVAKHEVTNTGDKPMVIIAPHTPLLRIIPD